jgi:hypothetical protein
MLRRRNAVRPRGTLHSKGVAPRGKALSESLLGKLGPGLITGAADDDPSGIATYSQGGAQFGYSLLWTPFFTYPLMVGIQVVSARIGRVSGYGTDRHRRAIGPKHAPGRTSALGRVPDRLQLASRPFANCCRTDLLPNQHAWVPMVDVLTISRGVTAHLDATTKRSALIRSHASPRSTSYARAHAAASVSQST